MLNRDDITAPHYFEWKQLKITYESVTLTVNDITCFSRAKIGTFCKILG